MWETDVDDTKVTLDKGEVESLFATKPAAAKTAPKVEETAKKTSAVALLDPKRAQALATALQSFKSTLKLSQQALCAALRDGDLQAFSSDRMEVSTVMTMLATVAPSCEEVEMVEAHDGPKEDLRDLEQFLLLVNEKVPRAVLRARCLSIRSTFATSCEERLAVMRAVAAAATEVRKSQALLEVIQFTLAIGNYMNGSSPKGGAWGFKLDALGKLANTKTHDNKRTLLHYVAEKLAPVRVVSRLRAELPSLAGLRFEWKTEAAELRELTASFKTVSNAVEHDTVEAFRCNTGSFVKSAKQLLDELQSHFKEAEAACKALASYMVEDSLKDEPESFLGMISAFVVSFEQADRFNQDAVRLEAQKKRREEQAAKASEDRKMRSTKGIGDTPQGTPLKVELNARVLNAREKAGIKNERKNLIDDVQSQMSFAASTRPRRHAASPRISKSVMTGTKLASVKGDGSSKRPSACKQTEGRPSQLISNKL